MSLVRTFLPWYRTGFAAALTGVPAGAAGRAGVPAALRLKGDAARGQLDVPMELAGPGDVLGLDPAEVLRTEPFDGCPDFEPSYFPYVELASPDLPWRFTPEGPGTAALPDPADAAHPGTQQWVRPWLVLVVVPVETSTLTPAAAGGVPVLHCAVADLPDPEESWAWAHVQLSHEAGQPPAQAIAAGRALARLVCPRRLAPGIAYRACVVPAFAAGRKAVLPGTPAADPLAPAWSGTGEVDLPVYLQWQFATGPEGSFEQLVRRMRPRQVPGTVGGLALATGSPGWGAAASSPDATATMQGALRPLGVPEPALGDPALAESLRTAVSNAGSGLELRPPLYGQDYQHGITALPAGSTGWLAELNTDPRRRTAAGLAAWAVAVHQEELADRAWQQLAATRTQESERRDPALAASVTASLVDRHAVEMPAVPALARLTRLAAPATLRAAGVPVTALLGASPLAATDAAAALAAAAAPAEGTFAPHYEEPAYTLLRAVAPEWLMPAVGDLPLDTVAVVTTNVAFVESFLVGLNHALARELTWRRFPVRAEGTFFDRFWSAGTPAVPPIDGWDPAAALGGHAQGDQLVLLLRGVLLRRYPTAAVYLSKAGPGGREAVVEPVFTGRIGQDSVFFGFPLTPAEVTAAGAGWSVVVQESLRQPRFGCDEQGEASAGSPTNWQELSWGHSQFTGRSHAPVAGPLAGRRLPASAGSATSAVWGLDAANLAVAVQQPAFRVRIPVNLWLGPLVSPEDPDV